MTGLLDLFDVYSELQEVSVNLSDFGSELAQFSSDDGTPYAEAGAKGTVLAARFCAEIRKRLVFLCHG